MGAALDHPHDQAGLLEDSEVSRQRRLGDAEPVCRLADRRGPEREPLYDAAPGGMREGGEGIVSHNANNVSIQYGCGLSPGGLVMCEKVKRYRGGTAS